MSPKGRSVRLDIVRPDSRTALFFLLDALLVRSWREIRKRVRGDGGKRRRRAIEPMSPSQLASPPQGKYLRKEEECVVWDEDSATNIRRRECSPCGQEGGGG